MSLYGFLPDSRDAQYGATGLMLGFVATSAPEISDTPKPHPPHGLSAVLYFGCCREQQTQNAASLLTSMARMLTVDQVVLLSFSFER